MDHLLVVGRSTNQSGLDNVQRLMKPRSVAVVGASEREGSFGQRLLRAIVSNGYAGAVYPINPRYSEVGGLPAYASLGATPELPDLVAFAISDDRLEQAFVDAASQGMKAAVIFGRCYEEYREGSVPLTERISKIAHEADIAICGGNCMGFVNLVDRLALSASPPPLVERSGAVGLVSHSGSTWSGLLGNQRGVVYNYAISAGQELSTTIGDYVRFLAAQPETRVVGCVLETLRNPEDFLAAVYDAGQRGIPVVALKLGRSRRGQEFALAHSGALAGADNVFQAAMREFGIISTDTLEEFEDTLAVFSTPRRPAATGIGIVTDSGGERQHIVDRAETAGVPLLEFSEETRAKLLATLDPGMTPDNPVDSYGDGRNLMAECMTFIAQDSDVGVVALATNLVAGRRYATISAELLGLVYQQVAKPLVLMANVASATSRELTRSLFAAGIPVLLGTTSSLKALHHFVNWQPPLPPASAQRDKESAIHDLLDGAAARQALAPAAAAEILDRYSLPQAPRTFASTRDGAVEAALRIGFPVVMKTANPAILHKTEHGGVVLSIGDEVAAGAAYDTISTGCGADVEVARQISNGVELILGMTTDRVFGPAITVGIGGIWTELFRDAVTFLPPVTPLRAEEYLRRLKGFPLLDGYRGAPRANLTAISGLISKFSAFCLEQGTEFSEIDLNPIKAGPDGAFILDSLFVRNS